MTLEQQYDYYEARSRLCVLRDIFEGKPQLYKNWFDVDDVEEFGAKMDLSTRQEIVDCALRSIEVLEKYIHKTAPR